MAVQVDFIKSLPYFAELSQAELDSIIKFIFEKKAERGEILLIEGDPAEQLYFVVDGVVKVLKTSVGGKEQILQIIRPGESFNDVPVFSGGANLASA
ncbi:MAG: cyclic nucleotide-binding domain-containing protein, partial [Dehalococcoidia bacterium]